MNAGEISTLMVFIEGIYGKNTVPMQTKTTIEAWMMVLQDISYQEAQLAVVALSSTNRDFPPLPGHIVGKVIEAKTKTMSAADAWKLIREAVRRFGYYNPNAAKDWLGPEIWETISRNGWEYFCTMERENMTTYYAQFRGAYEAEIQHKLEQAQIPQVVRAKLDAMRPQNLPPCLAQREQRKALEDTMGGK